MQLAIAQFLHGLRLGAVKIAGQFRTLPARAALAHQRAAAIEDAQHALARVVQPTFHRRHAAIQYTRDFAIFKAAHIREQQRELFFNFEGFAYAGKTKVDVFADFKHAVRRLFKAATDPRLPGGIAFRKPPRLILRVALPARFRAQAIP